jgi:NAD(P)-dependent dehydrogenase (short-subunit alcohol dehydrogenase family)
MSVFDLHGRKALVTGGARGLGAGMAEALARAGAAVAVADIREDIGKATVEALAKSGATARFIPLNVTDEASWEAAISQTINELDGLDIVVNNAGVEISELLLDQPAESPRVDREAPGHTHLPTTDSYLHAAQAPRSGVERSDIATMPLVRSCPHVGNQA